MMCVDCVKHSAEPVGPRRVLGLTAGDLDQMIAATCRTVDPELWWAYRTSEDHATAKRLCAGCPVRRLCVAQAFAFGENVGIWGGFDMSHEVDDAREWTRSVDWPSAVGA